MILDGLYIALVNGPTGVGVCPLPPTGAAPMNHIAGALVSVGSFSAGGDVPLGSCRLYWFRIVEVSTGDIVSEASVYINNT